MVIYFLILMELMRFSVEFCVVKFSSFGCGLWNKEWKEPKLGDAQGTPNIIQGHQKVKAWGCPGRHPLFCLHLSVTLLEAIFYSPHDMCFAWSVLYDLSL